MKQEEKEKEKLRKFEEKAEQEFKKVLDNIKADETTEFLEDIYFIPNHYVGMVANGNINGFFLYGEAGLGKSYLVRKRLKQLKKDFKVLSGHITPLQLYHFLFLNSSEIIVLDDINILENETNLNMLKAVLGEERVVSYETTSSKLKVPNKFVFEGRLIILLNSVPKKSPSLNAVKSRVADYELIMDYNTKIEVIFDIAKLDYEGISYEDRLLIAEWIKKHTSEATENLNLRLLFLFYEFYKYDKDNWQKLAKSSLKTNEYLDFIIQGATEFQFCRETGLNRATYYRYKQKVAKSHESEV